MIVFKLRINTLGCLALNIFGDADGVVNVVLLAFQQERYCRKKGEEVKERMVKEKG